MKETVKEALSQKKMSVEVLAERISLPRSSLNRWLREEKAPTSAKRRRVVAEALGLREEQIWPADY